MLCNICRVCVVGSIIFKFHRKFYCRCDQSLNAWYYRPNRNVVGVTASLDVVEPKIAGWQLIGISGERINQLHQ